MIRIAVIAAALVLASCSHYHPVLVCMPVSPDAIMCVDAEQLKAEQQPK